MYILEIKEIVKIPFRLLWLKWHWRGILKFSLFTAINRESIFEGANKIYPHAVFSGRLGYGSYIASHCEIYANIGRFCSIAPYVRTNIGVHPMGAPFATTSPMFFSTKGQTGGTFAERMMFDELREPTNIGNDVWVGENVFFAGGLTIGDGAVVLAGAVVTKDVPPYAVVGGVPARVLKYRYDKETISFLLKLKWWNLEIEWLKDNWELLCDIDILKEHFNGNPPGEHKI